MKKITLFKLFFVLAFIFVGQKSFSQDVDYTNLVINNDFEYQKEGVLNPAGTSWKPLLQTPVTTFYGWTCDLSNLGSTSQGINQDFTNVNGVNGCWVGGNCILPELYEFYQIIDKSLLPAGTYKVQCRLAVGDNKRTSQRLFANQNVQFHGTKLQYESNLRVGEIATFANWGDGEKNLQEMITYTTISDNDSLKIGIRTGSIKGDGNTALKASPMWGWFKVDYFRVTKIDPVTAADANLSAITLSAGEINFASQNNTYNVMLPVGTTSVTPAVVANVQGVSVAGADAVDVSSGAGVSTITVTALDGTTNKTYTINYTVGNTGLNDVNAQVVYSVSNGKLTVKGVDSYTVYTVNGVKVAEVNNGSEESANLNLGVYIVKTKMSGVFKVVVK